LAQGALWWLVPSLSYSSPPGELPLVLAVGHEFQLGSSFGPPLAFWMAEIAFRIAGAPGVYLLSQACIGIAYYGLVTLRSRDPRSAPAGVRGPAAGRHLSFCGADAGSRAGHPGHPLHGLRPCQSMACRRRTPAQKLVPARASARAVAADHIRGSDSRLLDL